MLDYFVNGSLLPGTWSTYTLEEMESIFLMPFCIDRTDKQTEIKVPLLVIPCPHKSDILLLYSHSNGTDLGLIQSKLYQLANAASVHIIAYDYFGYGKCAGRSTEQTVDNLLLAIYEDVIIKRLQWNITKLFFFGVSIGTGPTAKLVKDLYTQSQISVGGLILQCPYTDIKNAAASHVGKWLAEMIINNKWSVKDSLYQIGQAMESNLSAPPLLIIHGKKDALFAYSDSQEMLHSYKGRKKVFHAPEFASHNEWNYERDVIRPIAFFIYNTCALQNSYSIGEEYLFHQLSDLRVEAMDIIKMKHINIQNHPEMRKFFSYRTILKDIMLSPLGDNGIEASGERVSASLDLHEATYYHSKGSSKERKLYDSPIRQLFHSEQEMRSNGESKEECKEELPATNLEQKSEQPAWISYLNESWPLGYLRPKQFSPSLPYSSFSPSFLCKIPCLNLIIRHWKRTRNFIGFIEKEEDVHAVSLLRSAILFPPKAMYAIDESFKELQSPGRLSSNGAIAERESALDNLERSMLEGYLLKYFDEYRCAAQERILPVSTRPSWQALKKYSVNDLERKDSIACSEAFSSIARLYHQILTSVHHFLIQYFNFLHRKNVTQYVRDVMSTQEDKQAIEPQKKGSIDQGSKQLEREYIRQKENSQGPKGDQEMKGREKRLSKPEEQRDSRWKREQDIDNTQGLFRDLISFTRDYFRIHFPLPQVQSIFDIHQHEKELHISSSHLNVNAYDVHTVDDTLADGNRVILSPLCPTVDSLTHFREAKKIISKVFDPLFSSSIPHHSAPSSLFFENSQPTSPSSLQAPSPSSFIPQGEKENSMLHDKTLLFSPVVSQGNERYISSQELYSGAQSELGGGKQISTNQASLSSPNISHKEQERCASLQSRLFEDSFNQTGEHRLLLNKETLNSFLCRLQESLHDTETILRSLRRSQESVEPDILSQHLIMTMVSLRLLDTEISTRNSILLHLISSFEAKKDILQRRYALIERILRLIEAENKEYQGERQGKEDAVISNKRGYNVPEETVWRKDMGCVIEGLKKEEDGYNERALDERRIKHFQLNYLSLSKNDLEDANRINEESSSTKRERNDELYKLLFSKLESADSLLLRQLSIGNPIDTSDNIGTPHVQDAQESPRSTWILSDDYRGPNYTMNDGDDTQERDRKDQIVDGNTLALNKDTERISIECLNNKDSRSNSFSNDYKQQVSLNTIPMKGGGLRHADKEAKVNKKTETGYIKGIKPHSMELSLPLFISPVCFDFSEIVGWYIKTVMNQEEGAAALRALAGKLAYDTLYTLLKLWPEQQVHWFSLFSFGEGDFLPTGHAGLLASLFPHPCALSRAYCRSQFCDWTNQPKPFPYVTREPYYTSLYHNEKNSSKQFYFDIFGKQRDQKEGQSGEEANSQRKQRASREGKEEDKGKEEEKGQKGSVRRILFIGKKKKKRVKQRTKESWQKLYPIVFSSNELRPISFPAPLSTNHHAFIQKIMQLPSYFKEDSKKQILPHSLDTDVNYVGEMEEIPIIDPVPSPHEHSPIAQEKRQSFMDKIMGLFSKKRSDRRKPDEEKRRRRNRENNKLFTQQTNEKSLSPLEQRHSGENNKLSKKSPRASQESRFSLDISNEQCLQEPEYQESVQKDAKQESSMDMHGPSSYEGHRKERLSETVEESGSGLEHERESIAWRSNNELLRSETYTQDTDESLETDEVTRHMIQASALDNPFSKPVHKRHQSPHKTIEIKQKLPPKNIKLMLSNIFFLSEQPSLDHSRHLTSGSIFWGQIPRASNSDWIWHKEKLLYRIRVLSFLLFPVTKDGITLDGEKRHFSKISSAEWIVLLRQSALWKDKDDRNNLVKYALTRPPYKNFIKESASVPSQIVYRLDVSLYWFDHGEELGEEEQEQELQQDTVSKTKMLLSKWKHLWQRKLIMNMLLELAEEEQLLEGKTIKADESERRKISKKEQDLCLYLRRREAGISLVVGILKSLIQDPEGTSCFLGTQWNWRTQGIDSTPDTDRAENGRQEVEALESDSPGIVITSRDKSWLQSLCCSSECEGNFMLKRMESSFSILQEALSANPKYDLNENHDLDVEEIFKKICNDSSTAEMQRIQRRIQRKRQRKVTWINRFVRNSFVYCAHQKIKFPFGVRINGTTERRMIKEKQQVWETNPTPFLDSSSCASSISMLSAKEYRISEVNSPRHSLSNSSYHSSIEDEYLDIKDKELKEVMEEETVSNAEAERILSPSIYNEISEELCSFKLENIERVVFPLGRERRQRPEGKKVALKYRKPSFVPNPLQSQLIEQIAKISYAPVSSCVANPFINTQGNKEDCSLIPFLPILPVVPSMHIVTTKGSPIPVFIKK